MALLGEAGQGLVRLTKTGVNENMNRLLTRDEAAEILGVCRVTLSNWAANGSGPAYVKLGDSKRGVVRYPRDELEKFIESRTVKPCDVEHSASKHEARVKRCEEFRTERHEARSRIRDAIVKRREAMSSSDEKATSVMELGLSVRAWKATIVLGVMWAEELCHLSLSDLLLVDNCGLATVREIAEALSARGMSLAGKSVLA